MQLPHIDSPENVELAQLLMKVGDRAIRNRDVETLQDLSVMATMLSILNGNGGGDRVFHFDIAEYLYECSASISAGQAVADDWVINLGAEINAGLSGSPVVEESAAAGKRGRGISGWFRLRNYSKRDS